MRQRNMVRFFALLVCALVALQWVITAQAQTAGKRPLTYDAVDYWRAIQGTRLSNDGQWLAYAVTSQAEDGELIVRNLKTGQEFKHSRGTSPVFTQDGAFVVFTVAQSKADEEKDKQATRGSETQAAGGQAAGAGARGEGAAAQTPREPKTGLGLSLIHI